MVELEKNKIDQELGKKVERNTFAQLELEASYKLDENYNPLHVLQRRLKCAILC